MGSVNQVPASLLDLIAHGGSLRTAQDNQALAAETERERAATQLIGQETQQRQIDNQIAMQQVRDAQIARQIYAGSAQPSQPNPSAPTGAAAAPYQMPSPAGTPASATGQTGLINRTGAPVGNTPSVPSPAPAPPTGPAPQIATPAFNPNAPAANQSMVPAYLTDPGAMLQEGLRRGMSFQGAQNAANGVFQMQRNMNALKSEELEAHLKNYGIAKGGLIGYLDNPTPENYQTIYGHIAQMEPELAKSMPTPGQGVAPTAAQLGHVLGITNATETLLANAKQKADTAKLGAETANAHAQASENTAKAAIENLKLSNMRNANPASIGASVDAVIDPQKYPALNARAKGVANFALQRGDDPAEAIKPLVEQVGGIEKELNPDLRKARISDEVEKARQVAPIEVGKAVATVNATAPAEIKKAVQTQVEMAKLSGSPFASIADPYERHAAETQYDQASKEFLDKVASTRQLKDTLNEVKQGNKAAPSMAQIEMLRSQLNRINRTELEATSGAGNDLDRIQGWFGKHTAGDPIPKEVLEGMDRLADVNEKAAKRGYDYHLQILKQKGANVKPIELPGDNKGAGNTAMGGYQVGHKYGNLEYLGGDPHDRASWK